MHGWRHWAIIYSSSYNSVWCSNSCTEEEGPRVLSKVVVCIILGSNITGRCFKNHRGKKTCRRKHRLSGCPLYFHPASVFQIRHIVTGETRVGSLPVIRLQLQTLNRGSYGPWSITFILYVFFLDVGNESTTLCCWVEKVWCVLYPVEVGMEERTALQTRSDLRIPRNETAQVHSLVLNLTNHISVNYLYILTISPFILLQQIGGSILGIYKSLTDTWM